MPRVTIRFEHRNDAAPPLSLGPYEWVQVMRDVIRAEVNPNDPDPIELAVYATEAGRYGNHEAEEWVITYPASSIRPIGYTDVIIFPCD